MNVMKSSDKTVCKFLTVAASVAYDKANKKRTEFQIKVIKEAFLVLKQVLNLPEGVSIRLAHIKRGSTQGLYYHNPMVAEIEARRTDIMDLVRTLCHELVHAEQYHMGRLRTDYTYRVGYVRHWNGSVISNKGATYTSYRKQPWEQEAFGRQDELALFVASIIKGVM